MPVIHRQIARWTGFPGAPGFSNFFWSAPPANASLRNFFEAIKSSLPADVTVTVDTDGDTINDADGSFVGAWSGATGGATVGTGGAGGYSGASGAVIEWGCGNNRVGNRRLQGRTFIVPLVGLVYTPGGGINSTTTGQLQTAANGLVNAAPGALRVWSRPRLATTKNGVAVPARAGSSFPVVSTKIPAFAAVLRSRRG